MRKQNGKVMSAAVLAAGLLVAGRAMAGSLDPTNTPGPTMHTLEEIYQKVTAISYSPDKQYVVVLIARWFSSEDGTDDVVCDRGRWDLQKGVAWPNPRFTVGAGHECGDG